MLVVLFKLLNRHDSFSFASCCILSQQVHNTFRLA